MEHYLFEDLQPLGLPGVSEVKAFARQAVENVVVQSRDLLEQRTGEMKVPYVHTHNICIYIHR